MKGAGVWLALVGVTVAVACGTTTAPEDDGLDSDAGGAGAGADDGSASGGQGLSGGPNGDGGSSGSGTGGQPGTENGGMGGGASVVAEAFCEDYAEALCAWSNGCLTWPSCDSWFAYQNATGSCQDALASLDAGYLTFDAADGAGCLAAVEEVSCDGGPPFFKPEVIAACTGVFVGTLDVGDECLAPLGFVKLYDECEAGFCVPPEIAADCLGTCAAFKEDGEPCLTGDRCAAGLYCVEEECTPPSELGESCEVTPCASGLSCAETCRDPGEPGSECSDVYDCDWPGVCDGDTCVVDVGEGDLCRDDDTCQDGLYCRGSDDADPTCAVPVAASDPCDTLYDRCEAGYGCALLEPYVCVESLAGLDEPCGPSGCQGDLWCDPSDQMCRTRGGDGADCTYPYACEDDLLCMSDAQCHEPGDVDEPCSLNYSESCVDGLFCDRETLLCKSPRSEGETCNPMAAETSCEAGLYCACLASDCPYSYETHDPADVCAVPKDDGETCSASYECAGSYCVDEECTSEAPVAVTCSH